MRIFLTCLIYLCAHSPAFAKCDAGETKIRLGFYSDIIHQKRERSAKVLRDAINTEMQGKFCMELVADEKRFKGNLAATALQSGEIEMIASDFASLGTFSSSYRVFELPFAFSDIYALERFQAAEGPGFVDAMVKNGLQPLAFWHGGFKQIAAKRPLSTPQEAAGLSFRIDDSRTFLTQVSALKSTAQRVADNDLTIAVQSGKINAQYTNWVQGLADGSAKLLANVTETNHQFFGYQLMTSISWWRKQSPASKKSLIGLITRISRQTNFESTNQDTSAKRTLMRSGVSVMALTWHQRSQWKQVMQPIWDEAAYEGNARIFAAVEAANRQP